VPLTRRKIDFLEALIELYDKNKAPVHYVDVANSMGISKWTAYDMLTELEELGYVQSEYYIDEDKSLGRSILVYTPKESAYDVVNKSSTHEWNTVKEMLLNVIKKMTIQYQSMIL
jgi:Iron dependent repressor, N-terminal DNA binding domain.